MNFRFDARKATQVAAAFVKREGGELSIMKLVKLIYLLDRLSLLRRGVPVLGGDFELAEWCHHNCPKWRPVTQGRREIRVEDILEAGGRKPEYIKRVVAETAELRQLDAMLA